jgi:lysyl-tRNA synthetase class 2
LWVRLLLLTSRWFQIAALYRANAKLCPDWEPRFLCFKTVRDLGTVTVAGLRSEGLLTTPSLDPRGRWVTRAAARCLASASTGRATSRLVVADHLDPVPTDPVPADPVLAEPTREVALYASR